ncbi:MAG: phosphoribosylamine--glycine ligase [Selenomonadaceae bacterium]|nr:phosphoribosylamine--glycine ligase [Selenomonadaceae bacterium]
MNVLLIGSGGREHALAWKISQSPLLEKFYAIPGNPGISEYAECIKDISIDDNAAIVKFAQENKIDLVVVGPEAPLVNGVVDALESAGIKSFGCKKDAAQLEGSKIFAKNLMKKYNIPTAKFEVFDNPDAAKNYIRSEGAPIVIKADGLAAGKGVIVAQNLDDALNAVDEMKNFGAAGSKIVVEEFMDGEEASILAFTDGKTIIPMIAAQDHKRLNDGDKGVNTGGMGAYAPAPVVTEKVAKLAEEKILKPIIAALNAEGIIYRGCLYAGLMIVNGEPKVVEFNARFGDPETQAVLPLLDSDLLEIMDACATGNLADKKISWKNESAVCVVLASGGYPKAYKKNLPIEGITKAKSLGALIFHAGTAEVDGKILTSGGRVLGVTVTAENIQAAIEKVYKCVDVINFESMHYRKDIAAKALKF